MLQFTRNGTEMATASFGDKVNARIRLVDGAYQVKPTNRGYGAPVSETAPSEIGFVKASLASPVDGAADGSLIGMVGEWGLVKVARGWYTLVADGADVSVSVAPEAPAEEPAVEVSDEVVAEMAA